MAEPFSTFAGAVSLLDVAIKTCNSLYDSIRYLKDAPELSQRLQRTVYSVESILRNLESFIARHRQVHISALPQDAIPDAVTYEIINIKENLDVLLKLLPATNSNSRVCRGLKWVFDRKKLASIVQELEGHQTTLMLALQSFSQQSGLRLHEGLLDVAGKVERVDQSTSNSLKAIQDSLNTGLHTELRAVSETGKKSVALQESVSMGMERLHSSVLASRAMSVDKFEAIECTLSEMRVNNRGVMSNTVVTAPTEDILARVVRAELQRVIMPTVKQCFDTFKSNSDAKVDGIRDKIDEMTEQLGKCLSGNIDNNFNNSGPQSQEAADEKTPQEDPGELGLAGPAILGSGNFGIRRYGIATRECRHWRRSWIFEWAIGTLRVTISTSVISRNTPHVFHVGEIPFLQRAYRVTIEFLPAQRLIKMRGLTLSIEKVQDQRGYNQICPLLSTFAVVHRDADVMRFARMNNVAGLKDLFNRRLAAPSDRDEYGWTPLMYAARLGALNACRLLLAEGSDPLAVNRFGYNSLDLANLDFFEEGPGNVRIRDSEDSVVGLRLLQQAAGDIDEDTYRNSREHFGSWLSLSVDVVDESVDEWTTRISPFVQLLKQSNFDLNFRRNKSEHGDTPMHAWCYWTLYSDQPCSMKVFRCKFRVLLELGADVRSTNFDGETPLHHLFRPFEDEDQRHNTADLATLLLEHGADPCALTDDGYSVSDDADWSGCTAEWLEALERAGIDIDEVEREIERREWFFDNPDHGFAESTAVDIEEVAPPSAEGLSRRRAIISDTLED